MLANEIKHNRKLLNILTLLWCLKAVTDNGIDLGVRQTFVDGKAYVGPTLEGN